MRLGLLRSFRGAAPPQAAQFPMEDARSCERVMLAAYAAGSLARRSRNVKPCTCDVGFFLHCNPVFISFFARVLTLSLAAPPLHHGCLCET